MKIRRSSHFPLHVQSVKTLDFEQNEQSQALQSLDFLAPQFLSRTNTSQVNHGLWEKMAPRHLHFINTTLFMPWNQYHVEYSKHARNTRLDNQISSPSV